MVHLQENERGTVFSCSGIVRYLFFLGKPAVVQASEIDLMKHHLNGVYNDINVTNLYVGESHTITQGSLFWGPRESSSSR